MLLADSKPEHYICAICTYVYSPVVRCVGPKPASNLHVGNTTCTSNARWLLSRPRSQRQKYAILVILKLKECIHMCPKIATGSLRSNIVGLPIHVLIHLLKSRETS